MADLKDITERAPNPDLVEQLERMLEFARAGEVRSWVSAFAWVDGAMTHGWALDGRSPKIAMLGSLNMAQFALSSKVELEDDSSELFKAVYG